MRSEIRELALERKGACGAEIAVEIRRGAPAGDFVGWLPAEGAART